MSEVKFSKEHEWIKLEGDVATIGITKHATEMLGDIVFAELPEKGSKVEKDGTAGVVESTKAASDVYTPVSGEVVDTNQTIVDDPAKINDYTEYMAGVNLYEALTTLDGSGAIQPLLSESWSTSEDGLTWTFKLKKGATFQDGSPVEAKDVVWSVNRLLAINEGPAYIILSLIHI